MNLNKKELSKDELLKYVQDVDIFSYYIGVDLTKIRGNILSPLRKESRPSFGFFVGTTGELCYNDFLIGKGDCIKFVQKLFNLSFMRAMSKIVIDFKLTDEFFYIDIANISSKPPIDKIDRESIISKIKEHKSIQIKRRPWCEHDLKFWASFGISSVTLSKYNVTPIQYFFINDLVIKAKQYAYAFSEFKDGTLTYKIYQPYSADYKWITNHNEEVWQGWEQLPKRGEMLILTKSLKDVMSIQDTLGIPAVALQNEKILPKNSVMAELKKRFTDIYILYDNDYDKSTNWGEETSKEIALQHNLYFTQIDKKYSSKDFSDLVKKAGKLETKKIWDNEISIPY